MNRIMKRPILPLLLLFVVSGAWTQNVFQPYHREVQDLRYLYSRARLSFPETSFPLSRRDLRRRALELADAPQAAGFADQVEAYIEALGYSDEDITVAAALDFFFEVFSYNIDIDNYDDLSEKVRDIDPFAVLRLGYAHDAVGSLFIRGDATAEYNQDGYTNYPPYRDSRPFSAEYNFVREGYLQYFFGPMETVFGRQKLHIGPAPRTSLYVSHEIPFLDALRVKLPFGPLTMTMIWATMENRRTVQERDIGVDSAQPDPNLYAWSRNVILNSIQRFEWDFGRLRAGIGARTIIVREMNEFHLADLFPVFSRHNANIVPNNLSVVGDVSYAAAPGLETYLLFGFDDMNAELIGYGDDAIPTIGAYVAGAVYRRRLPQLWFSGDVELGTTHDLWGSFENDEFLARAVYRMDLVGPKRAMPLTSPYGPGVVWGRIGGAVETAAGLDAALSLLLLNRNTALDLYAGSYDGDSRDADRATSFRADVDLRYRFGGRSYATLSPSLLVDTGGPEWRVALGFGSGIAGSSRVGGYRP